MPAEGLVFDVSIDSLLAMKHCVVRTMLLVAEKKGDWVLQDSWLFCSFAGCSGQQMRCDDACVWLSTIGRLEVPCFYTLPCNRWLLDSSSSFQ